MLNMATISSNQNQEVALPEDDYSYGFLPEGTHQVTINNFTVIENNNGGFYKMYFTVNETGEHNQLVIFPNFWNTAKKQLSKQRNIKSAPTNSHINKTFEFYYGDLSYINNQGFYMENFGWAIEKPRNIAKPEDAQTSTSSKSVFSNNSETRKI